MRRQAVRAPAPRTSVVISCVCKLRLLVGHHAWLPFGEVVCGATGPEGDNTHRVGNARQALRHPPCLVEPSREWAAVGRRVDRADDLARVAAPIVAAAVAWPVDGVET